MARDVLYVANLDAAAEPDDLAAVFEGYGPVEAIEIGHNDKFDVRCALVKMAVERNATQAMHDINDAQAEDQQLYVSYPAPDPFYYQQGLSKKARATAEEVCKAIGEQYRKPVRRIHTMVLVCGHSFVLAVLREAQAVFNGEGMLTQDGSRKRELGGVFFVLAHRYMSPSMYALIHSRSGKLPGYQIEDDRAIYHLIVNPHEDV